MIVVSNTSPIINLYAIGQLDLLRRLYGTVVIPQAVHEEITHAGEEQPGSTDIETHNWIVTRSVADQALMASLRLELDEGEAGAIALAVEQEADLILLDERKGRRIAARLGLHPVGLLGVLIEAKHAGIISTIRPVVDDLIARSGFWLGQELYDRILRDAGE